MVPITTCPHCSILIEGTCIPCRPGDDHPSCRYCKNGSFSPPWYKSEKLHTALAIASASVASALILAMIRRRYGID